MDDDEVPDENAGLKLERKSSVDDAPPTIQTDKRLDKRLEDSECRVLKTIALYAAFSGMGFCAPLVGMTIVHMEYVLGASAHVLAFTFLCHSLGYTLGGVICGLIFDRTNNKELAFSVAIIVEASTTVTAGFMSSTYAYMAVLLMQGISLGFIDGGGQSYCVNLWTNHRLKEPLLQASHALWSLAATLGPFIIRPFLVELETPSSSTATDWNNATNASDAATTSSEAPRHDSPEVPEGIENVRFAYLAMSGLVFASGSFFFVLYCRGCSRSRSRSPVVVVTAAAASRGTSSEEEPDDGAATTPGGRSKKRRRRRGSGFLLLLVKASFLAMIFLFYYLYICVEGIPMAYFTSFVLKHLRWSVRRSTLIMTVFFGAQFAGRVVGVPLSVFLRTRTMLCVDVSLTAVAFLLLLLVDVADGVMWVSSGLSGFAMGSTFATMVLWVSESVPLTGRVSSVMLVGGSVGGMTGPLLVGQLFDAASPMWMVYILVVCALLHVVLVVALFLFVREWKRPFGDSGKEEFGGEETAADEKTEGDDVVVVGLKTDDENDVNAKNGKIL